MYIVNTIGSFIGAGGVFCRYNKKTILMKSGETIDFLYAEYRQGMPYELALPFGVKKLNWTKDFYVIVESVSLFSAAHGYPTRNGCVSRLFLGDHKWRDSMLIPKWNEPIWELSESSFLDRYKVYNNKGKNAIYELDDRLRWGKYKGYSILEICMENAKYIEWCIHNIREEFCLNDEALFYLIENGIEFSNNTIRLNHQKKVWFMNDYEDFLEPTF